MPPSLVQLLCVALAVAVAVQLQAQAATLHSQPPALHNTTCAPPCTTNCTYHAQRPRGNCCNATDVCAFDTVFHAYRCHPSNLICEGRARLNLNVEV